MLPTRSPSTAPRFQGEDASCALGQDAFRLVVTMDVARAGRGVLILTLVYLCVFSAGSQPGL